MTFRYSGFGAVHESLDCAGAPSLVSGGGAVGASDLLKAPSEIFETDMSMPVPRLAQKVLPLICPLALCSLLQRSNACSSASA